MNFFSNLRLLIGWLRWAANQKPTTIKKFRHKGKNMNWRFFWKYLTFNKLWIQQTSEIPKSILGDFLPWPSWKKVWNFEKLPNGLGDFKCLIYAHHVNLGCWQRRSWRTHSKQLSFGCAGSTSSAFKSYRSQWAKISGKSAT